MTTISIPGFIVAKVAAQWETARIHGMALSFWDFKPVGTEHTVVCPHTLTFDVPVDFDPRPEQIKHLEAQQRDLDAKYAAGSAFIRQQIASLQAIEHAPA